MSDAPRPDLGELARLATLATPGPWKRLEPDENYDQHSDIATKVVAEHGASVLRWRVLAETNPRYPNAANDAAFIAACSPAVILQLVALAAGGAAAEARLHWVRDRCRVVFYPGDLAYPIEHTKFARKDSWDHLMAECERENPAARSLTPERPADA